jgi:hypothetical protein
MNHETMSKHHTDADVNPLGIFFFTEQEPVNDDLIEFGPSNTEGFASLGMGRYFGRWSAELKRVIAPDLRLFDLTGRRGWCWRWVPGARLVHAELLHDDNE